MTQDTTPRGPTSKLGCSSPRRVAVPILMVVTVSSSDFRQRMSCLVSRMTEATGPYNPRKLRWQESPVHACEKNTPPKTDSSCAFDSRGNSNFIRHELCVWLPSPAVLRVSLECPIYFFSRYQPSNRLCACGRSLIVWSSHVPFDNARGWATVSPVLCGWK